MSVVDSSLFPVFSDLWSCENYSHATKKFLSGNGNTIATDGGVVVKCRTGDPCDVLIADNSFHIVAACCSFNIPVTIITSQVDWMRNIIGNVAGPGFTRKNKVLSLGFRFVVDDEVALGRAFKEELIDAFNRIGNLGFDVFPLLTFDNNVVREDMLTIALSTFTNPHCRKAFVRLPGSEVELRAAINGLSSCFNVTTRYTEEKI